MCQCYVESANENRDEIRIAHIPFSCARATLTCTAALFPPTHNMLLAGITHFFPADPRGRASGGARDIAGTRSGDQALRECKAAYKLLTGVLFEAEKRLDHAMSELAQTESELQKANESLASSIERERDAGRCADEKAKVAKLERVRDEAMRAKASAEREREQAYLDRDQAKQDMEKARRSEDEAKKSAVEAKRAAKETYNSMRANIMDVAQQRDEAVVSAEADRERADDDRERRLTQLGSLRSDFDRFQSEKDLNEKAVTAFERAGTTFVEPIDSDSDEE